MRYEKSTGVSHREKKARKREGNRGTWRQQDVSFRIRLLFIDEMFHIVQRQISL